MIRPVAGLLVLLTLALGAAVAVPAAAPQVSAQGDLVTAIFEATPVPEALEAIRRATGVEVVVPGSVQSKTLTLAVERVPFDQLARRLLLGLGLGGFALIYESNGAARRLIVVDQARGGPPPANDTRGSQPSPEPGVTSRPAESEPVYIPPASPPVYIPPANPPVYIPPAAPPVYIPPATPPVYVPPAGEPRPAPSP